MQLQLTPARSVPLRNRGTVFPQRNFIVVQTSPFLPNSNVSNPAMFHLAIKSYSVLQVMILTRSLPDYWTKYTTRNKTSVTLAFAPTVMKRFLAKNKVKLCSLLQFQLTCFKWAVEEKSYGDCFKTGKWRKSHGNAETRNSTWLPVLRLSTKGALKHTSSQRKASGETAFCFRGTGKTPIS